MVRPPCCDRLNVKRGLWTAEEDAKVIAHVSKHGTGNWTAVPKKAGLRRCGKSCRLRWTNYLRPDLKHEGFTAQEEELIVRLHAAIGSRWSIIAQQLPGRTDNDVKNYWNTKLRKRLSEMGIDPVTHKPFSQILVDYGNIGGGLPNGGTRIGSLNRDLKNAYFMLKTEHSAQVPVPAEGFPNINTHLMTTIMSLPKIETNQDTFFNSNINNNHSMDLLAQLQAIKLVTEASNCTNHEAIPPHIFSESSSLSSPSSSSSSCSTAAKVEMPQNFSWRDFLLDDAFLPADSSQEEENMAGFLSKNDSSRQTQNVMSQCEFNTNGEMNFNGVGPIDCKLPSNGVEGSLCSDGSFVEAMLDRDNEMLLEFPGLLDEPFY
ncbi:hypothetical protein L1049_028347 [Liquidambar formosana]|uniref:Uncharacterized protein n=1 Tax=Liquidambar formosana TaxID=63359 RepID=A0AAP0WT80_LIQFO